ncbi:MAG: hypothetical protein VX519_10345, partial [Myxococcota bacterium]|nr:hypothetical protein [Myxococcota bacterium]
YALDKWNLSHGSVSAHRIVIGGDGRPQLLGAQFSGEPDLVALLRLLKELWPDSVELLESVESLAALKQVLEASLRDCFPQYAPFRLGARSWEQAPRPESEGVRLEVVLDGSVGSAADEVTYDIGPDPVEPGLLDQWDVHSSSHATETRECTMAGVGDREDRNRSMVARLVSPPLPPPDPYRFDGVVGTACEPLKRLLADEPFDPLPLTDGIRPDLPPELAPEEREEVEEKTYTATVTRFTEEIPIRALHFAIAGLVAAALVLLAMVYRFLF